MASQWTKRERAQQCVTVRRLRIRGYGYRQIAEKTGLPLKTAWRREWETLLSDQRIFDLYLRLNGKPDPPGT